MSDSTSKRARVKPAKPHPDYPLFAHNTGRWAKKVKGKFIYLGAWDDPDGALQNWVNEKDYILLHGCRPPEHHIDDSKASIRDLANNFLTSKETSRDSGEITSRTFDDYHKTCELIIKQFGKHRSVESLLPADFEAFRSNLAKTRGLTTLGNAINRIRVVFRYAYDSCLVEAPVRFGPAFKRPSKSAIRKQKAAAGPRMYEADEIRKMLARARSQMRAMILLACNGGLGNGDIGRLEFRHIQDGWIDYPRIKTGIARRFPLWPETAAAVTEVINARKEPVSSIDESIVFLTSHRVRWYKEGNARCPVSAEFRKLARAAGVYRPRVGFYGLRHVFETIASGTMDQPAVDRVMGHGDGSMAAVYRERLDDDRLRRVVDHVQAWLFAGSDTKSDDEK